MRMTGFRSSAGALTLVAALAMAGAASAQTLPAPNDPAWAVVGEASGATYAVLPSSLAREGQVVRFLMRATVPPPPTGNDSNAVIAQIVMDCATQTIGRGTTEFYSVASGAFVGGAPREPVLEAVSDPGQTLLIQHVCAV